MNSVGYLVAFGGGLLLSFTPCIYPLVPISAGFIGARSAGSKIRGLFLSLMYVSGIALTYSALGILAALSGEIFGRISTHPITRLVAGCIIVLFGISLFDGFGFKMPFISQRPVPHSRRKGYLTTLFLGITSGLVISPCTSPVLGSILLYVATKKDLFYAASLLLVFAYGMGTLLILAGTFSGILVNLPTPGRWMLWFKKIAAVILIIMGIYFIVISGVGSDAFAQKLNYAPDFTLKDLEGREVSLYDFKDKPLILFFWTSWCPFCRKGISNLNNIYSDLETKGIKLLAINLQEPTRRIKRFLTTHPVIFTVLQDIAGDLVKPYRIWGVPTYVFINSKGIIVFKNNYFPQDYQSLFN
jgi:thiol:disulfide interchange protein DsbD